ncbi:MAG: hypothetical protein LBU42_01685 [Prevotellaceae bacterium]|jgi:hypothetical protein|nr:hypothetical protein [Prevotellaceae bacterium]
MHNTKNILTVNGERSTANGERIAKNCLLPTKNCLLKTACCLLFTACCLLLPSGCHYFASPITDEKIAEVNGKVLFKSGIDMIFPSGLSPEDSLHILQTYVSNWARKQLVAEIAEQYLNKEQKNVSEELEDYRMSLLIYRYEKMYMEQRLDTIVGDREIEAFYNASDKNFLLPKPVAQVIFIKVSEDIPQVKEIEKVYRSSTPENREALDRICSTIAEKYTNFNEQWVDAETLASELPLSAGQIENEWENGYIQATAGGYAYFVHLYRTAAAGDRAPLDYERENISNIIRNKRKQELLKNLENSIYNDALNHNKLKLYINN